MQKIQTILDKRFVYLIIFQQNFFTSRETELDYYQQKVNVQVAKRLKT